MKMEMEMENKTIVTGSAEIESMINSAVAKTLSEFHEKIAQKMESAGVILDRTKAADFLCISMSTLGRWTKAKLIPSYGIPDSDKVYYKKSDLLDSLIRTN